LKLCRTPASVSTAKPGKRSKKLAVAKYKALIWPAVIIAVVDILDQLTKSWAVQALTDQPSRRVLGSFLMFTLVYNEGGAMGTSLGSSGFYIIIAFVVIPILLYFIYKDRDKLALSLPLAFIVAGAVGNLIDRVRLGKVIDFIDMDFFHVNIWKVQIERWWTFNIADASITCALVFLIIHQLFFHPRTHPEPSAIDTPTSDTPSSNSVTS
jgi:signal peptidase II